MESLSIRFEKSVLDNIDKSIKKNNFNSRTEFIRTAVREKISELEHKRLIAQFMSCGGKYPPTSEEEREKARLELSEKMLKDFKKGL